MEYQYIQTGDKSLNSVYHMPESMERDTGIVFCYPLGQEYIRCHRLFVNMANKSALLGYNTLRFDYSGTGDSSGDFKSLTLNSCLNDIHTVVQELKNTCDVSKIILIGVRFGATLSLLYSQKYKVDKLVLWSPVYNGQKYLKGLVKDYKNWLEGSFTKEKIIQKNGLSSFGYFYSSDLIKEIEGISPNVFRVSSKIPTLLIDNDIEPVYKDFKNVNFEKIVNDEFWLKRDDEREKSFVPINEVNKIIDWISTDKNEHERRDNISWQ